MTASNYPQFFRVRQKFEGPRVADVSGEVEGQLSQLKLSETIRPGQSVAVTCGSRGIANISLIIKAIVGHLKQLGAKPFIVPAMGSHGGGTAEGQRQVLESYGVTEERCGCPMRATMETVVLCQIGLGFPVHVDRFAFEADHVVLCGRIKPHTDFDRRYRKRPDENDAARPGQTRRSENLSPRRFRITASPRSCAASPIRVLAKCHIAAGVGIVENGYDETALIEAVRPGDIERREKELLVLAKQWMPRLPFGNVDILIVDEMGKNISGAGIDTNVVGRKRGLLQAGKDEYPKVKRIIVRSLTEASHGNAVGLGYVDVCKTSLLNSHDRHATWTNIITSGNLGGMKYPMHFETDREILDVAPAFNRLNAAAGRQSAMDQKHAALEGSRVLGGLPCRSETA